MPEEKKERGDGGDLSFQVSDTLMLFFLIGKKSELCSFAFDTANSF